MPTVEQIDGVVWPDPPADATRLVRTVHALRRKTIGSMSAEDLRIMLGQGVDVAALVPCSLALLEQNPLAQGNCYPGDLLVATLRSPDNYWAGNPDMAAKLRSIIDRFRQIDDLDHHFPPDDQIWARIDQLCETGCF
ncbi:contact-dependent growth inhibition system immunity protein [Nocardia sp. NPDC052316]|uniref:contact-dependent growth inhibition system immunity protein n=1 Tax=Nocardia sp. NPDC052316 TaxID=3364329 RepID=UPI0037C9A784